MRRRDWLLAAISSGVAWGARPRYGGTLRVYPSMPGADKEPFTRLTTSGVPDAARRVWRFGLRPNVMLQGNTPWTPIYAAERLKSAGFVGVSSSGNTVTVAMDAAAPDLPRLLDRRVLVESGAFEPVVPAGPKPTMRANELYWNGRAFLDSIELAGSAQEADLVELSLSGSRRIFRMDSHRIWSTLPVEVLAVDASGTSPAVRQALSLAIDRTSIVKVLLQGHGEAAGGLAPQWLSGYAFVFPVATDLAKAKALVGAARPAQMTLSYVAGDTVARLIAERIAVNARDIGLALQPKSVASAELKMLREPVQEWPSYDAERAAIEDRKLIPVVHVPRLYAIHNRVRGWDEAHDGRNAELHLESIWVDA